MELAEKLGLTKTKLAKALGVTPNCIFKIFRGDQPSIRLVVSLRALVLLHESSQPVAIARLLTNLSHEGRVQVGGQLTGSGMQLLELFDPTTLSPSAEDDYQI